MKPATVLASLTAATAVGLVDAQFVTSKRSNHEIEPRIQDFPKTHPKLHTLSPRQDSKEEDEAETVIVKETKTVKPPQDNKQPTTKPKASTTTSKDEKSSSTVVTTTSASSQTTPESSSTESPSPTESEAVESSTPAEPSEDDDPSKSESESSGGIPAGTAAGIAAGAVAGLALIGLIIFFIYRKKQGPIRGAVVTADYPDDMMMVEKDMNGGGGDAPSLPDIAGLEGQHTSWGAAAIVPGGQAYTASPQQQQQPGYISPPPQQQQFAPQPGGQAYTTSSPSHQPGYISPPERKLTAEGLPVGMAMSAGEYHSYNPQRSQPQTQPVSPLEERRRASSARPVSAYLQGYPSPGNPPILPVSPMSTYYPDRQSSVPPLPLPTPQGPAQISAYYPGANNPPLAESSPSHLPQFMIPGGTRSGVMSYSSQYTSGGGIVDDGVPAPPFPSMPVMENAGEPPLSPLRRNPYEALR
ncbi:hypothetical protein QBC38DRAFT_253099 [Podospora fimiseda]|uniref:Mid2 domain-containing protein n=1 Tax=Podospora fimiseda TaxID=252190 RepID=A0AAN7BM05_9PEZI|nr:hypothetical protein QBC38DRAFT_253099 [Podospora fimiseda]